MPNPRDGNAGLSVHQFFKLKNHNHVTDDAPDGMNSSFAPRPNLRRDIIENREFPFDFFGEAEIKTRIVNQNDASRFQILDTPDGVVENLADPEILAENIAKAE